VTDAEFLAGWEDAADVEMCLAPSGWPTSCSDTIIRAHTVQRMGGGLRAIARSGEVYGFQPHPYFFQKNDMQVIPKLIGTRKASTFRGFCDLHDRQLFEPAEHHQFAGAKEQFLALNFRVIAKRVFSKTISVRHATRMFNYDRGLPPLAQREYFAVQYQDQRRVNQQLANVRALKKDYDDRLLENDVSEVNAFVLYFAGRPEFQCAELVAIHSDFSGNRLEEPAPPAHLCVYTVAINGEWAFVFSWIGANSAAEALSRSLDACSDTEKPNAVLRYAIEHTDNIFFAPDWWESLAAKEREAVIAAFTRRMHPHHVWKSEVLRSQAIVPVISRFSRSAGVGSWWNSAKEVR
jgi:hypothetical protein